MQLVASYPYRVYASNASGISTTAAEVDTSTKGGKSKVAAQVNFGRVARGHAKTGTLLLANTSRTEPLRVSVSGAASPFVAEPTTLLLASKGKARVSITFTRHPLRLPVSGNESKGKARVSITFTPASAGRFTGSLVIAATDQASPRSIRLIGSGR